MLFCVTSAVAQPSDSLFVQSAITVAKEFRSTQIGVEPHLFNGVEHTPVKVVSGQHPYYKSHEWLRGSINYSNQYYENLRLLYDLVNDQLILQNFNQSSAIQLVNIKLKSFELEGREFINIADKSLPAAGFYEVLYDGPTRLLSKRTKRAWKQTSSGKIEQLYKERSLYFILVDSRYIPVKNKRDILKIFSTRKKELNAYIRKQASSLTNEGRIIAIVKYKDSLTK